MHDSIKYIEPIYTNAQRNDFDWDGAGKPYDMDNRFDDVENRRDVMYESTESRYATELVTVKAVLEGNVVTVNFKSEAAINDAGYVPGGEAVYVMYDGRKYCIAMRNPEGHKYGSDAWFRGSIPTANTPVEVTNVAFDWDSAVLTLTLNSVEGISAPSAVARYNSERDLTGKYLGEVELRMRDYHFQPRPITLGVTWTQLTELVLDTSFGVSAEEMLMDSAAQEIKKTLDFQAVKYASDVQKVKASGNFAQFDAGVGNKDNDDSYFYTAQLIGQAIGRIADIQLNEFNRGGVSSIVGGPAAVRYLQLHKGWKDTGKQPAIGGHKVGELDGIPVFKVPASIVADDELLTVWKNDVADSDVAIAIGTLLPFYSTGALQRKNLYKEAAVARFEDMKALQPRYLGRVQINGIREITV